MVRKVSDYLAGCLRRLYRLRVELKREYRMRVINGVVVSYPEALRAQ